MKTKKYEVEIMGTTYRTYFITAESENKAIDMAFEAVDEDWEISKAWKQNAELSFIEEVEEKSITDRMCDDLIELHNKNNEIPSRNKDL